MHKKVEFSNILAKMQWTWILCFGALTLLVVLGYWVNPIWLPFIGLALMAPVTAFSNMSLAKGHPNCSLLIHYTDYTLFFSSLVMIIINLINSKWVESERLISMQSDIPFVPALVVYTVSAIMFGVSLCRRSETEYCKACKEQSGHTLRESLRRNVLHGEAKYQMKMMFVLTLFMAVLGWAYYNVFYINVNFNSPDTFFFFMTPGVVYGISVVFIITRYSSMQFEVAMAPGRLESESKTIVRYMVVKEDKLLLELVAMDGAGSDIWDTPAVTEIAYVDEMTDEEARDIFQNSSGSDNFTLKRLFTSTQEVNNAMHYAVFLPLDEPTPGFGGQLYTLYEVNQMMRTGHIARPFAYEIHRVFTITMAWKTYDREGKRLYPIKNYRPTFRISDFKDWDVDYSDLHWISVSKNNEDQPFFKLRRFWWRHISGVDLRWKKRQY